MSSIHFHHGVRINGLRHLFDGMSVHDLPGAGRPSRATFLSRPGDVVQLPTELAPFAEWARHHANAIGLPVGDVVFSDEHGFLPGYEHLRKDAFCLGDHFAPTPEHLEAVKWLNNKNHFIAWCEQHGWPVPNTVRYTANAAPGDWPGDWPMVVKGAVSAAAHDVTLCDDRASLLAATGRLAGRDYQLQAYLENASFYGVQVRRRYNGTVHLRVTKQVLSGRAYAGATTQVASGVERTILRTVMPCAQAIAALGLDTFGLDVGVLPDGAILLLECNPRYGATVYPTRVAARLRHRNFIYRYVPVEFRDLNVLDLSELGYDPKRRSGVVVVDWGSVIEGELGVLFLAPTLLERVRLVGLLSGQLQLIGEPV